MKKIIYSTLLLLAIACKSEPAAPEDPLAKDCQIQKITTSDNRTYNYKFDASNRLSEVLYKYLSDGKPEEITIKFAYNGSGNLLKTTNSEGWVDEYIYDASGVLTRIDFKNPDGKLDDQYTITLDAQKRITSMTTLKYGLTVSYEYKGTNGLFSRSLVKYAGFILDDYQVKSYESDNTKKFFGIAVKGHLFDPTLFTDDIPYSNPLNFTSENLLVTSAQATTQYDENWENLKSDLRLYWDVTVTRKYNENGYMIQEEGHDKLENTKNAYLYAYANCN